MTTHLAHPFPARRRCFALLLAFPLTLWLIFGSLFATPWRQPAALSATVAAPVNAAVNTPITPRSGIGLNPVGVAYSVDDDRTKSIALGDVDGDGDLDIATGNGGDLRTDTYGYNTNEKSAPIKIYRNDGARRPMNRFMITQSQTLTGAYSVAWGDVDGDGDLDLAAGNDGDDYLYLFQQGQVAEVITLTDSTDRRGDSWTHAVAWGDANGDGVLDLALGNTGADRILFFQHETARLTVSHTLTLPKGNRDTNALAWGYVDGDDRLDLAIGSYYKMPSVQLYSQMSNGRFTITNAITPPGRVTALAWGQGAGGGVADLAIGAFAEGNAYTSAIHYLQNSGCPTSTAQLLSLQENQRTYSVAWGDVDNDGDLDLATAGHNTPNRVYLRANGCLNPQPVWESSGPNFTYSLAWGDMDGDGDLDLVTGGAGHDYIYFNEGIYPAAQTVYATPREPITTNAPYFGSVALGDVDGDGDWDLATSVYAQPIQVLINERGFTRTRLYTVTDYPLTGNSQLFWGHFTADERLDLLVIDPKPNIYQNRGLTLPFQAITIADSIAVNDNGAAPADVDNDGDLDLLLAGNGGVFLYTNNGAAVFTRTTLGSTINARSLALGDVDNDGDLDLAFVADNKQVRLYRYDGTRFQPDATAQIAEEFTINHLAWGDLNQDGLLDLALAIAGYDKVYLNQGGALAAQPGWIASVADYTARVVWGDVDGDGDLDLVTGNVTAPSATANTFLRIYRNDLGQLQATPLWTSANLTHASALALGDLDGNGALDLATPGQWYRLGRPAQRQLAAGRLPASQPVMGAFLAQPRIMRGSGVTVPAQPLMADVIADPVIVFTYTLFHPLRQPVRQIRADYSLDGGGRWLPAYPTDDTSVTNLATNLYPTPTISHRFAWDTLASGFFGQSDQVILRLVAYPDSTIVTTTPAAQYTTTLPGPFQLPAVVAQTLPFRARGSQVRVVDSTGLPIANAIVYRLPKQQTSGGTVIKATGKPFHTNQAGYLAGYGELVAGDRLLALQAITKTGPLSDSQRFTLYQTSAVVTVTAGADGSRVQTLTVTANRPLYLFDLTFGLEWDAQSDPAFLARLKQNLERSSLALYDWTDGQMALGQVTVYQNKEQWDAVDVQILASNQVRPIAHWGGIVTGTLPLTFSPSATQPITATPGKIRLGATWNRYGEAARTIGDDWQNALAHELGHWMLFLQDSYLQEVGGRLVNFDACVGTAMTDPYLYSEFTDKKTWQATCQGSMSEAADWTVLQQMYPAVITPTMPDPGPTTMPFSFTQVTIQPPTVAITVIPDSNVQLYQPNGEFAGGRAYLIRHGDRVVDLGGPIGNLLSAPGAQAGDLLCLFATKTSACTQIGAQTPLILRADQPAQPPQINFRATSRKMVEITNRNATAITATAYASDNAPQHIQIPSGQTGTLTFTAPANTLLLAVSGENPVTQTLVTGHVLSGGPGRLYSNGVPLAATDGSVMVLPTTTFPADAIMTLQLALTSSTLPSDVTALGRIYALSAVPLTAQEKMGGSGITFQYLELERLATGKPEATIAIHHQPPDQPWQRLDTTLDITRNFASALMPGAGLYALTIGEPPPLIQQIAQVGTSVVMTGQHFLQPLALSLLDQKQKPYALSITDRSATTLTATSALSLTKGIYTLIAAQSHNPLIFVSTTLTVSPTVP